MLVLTPSKLNSRTRTLAGILLGLLPLLAIKPIEDAIIPLVKNNPIGTAAVTVIFSLLAVLQNPLARALIVPPTREEVEPRPGDTLSAPNPAPPTENTQP